MTSDRFRNACIVSIAAIVALLVTIAVVPMDANASASMEFQPQLEMMTGSL